MAFIKVISFLLLIALASAELQVEVTKSENQKPKVLVKGLEVPPLPKVSFAVPEVTVTENLPVLPKPKTDKVVHVELQKTAPLPALAILPEVFLPSSKVKVDKTPITTNVITDNTQITKGMLRSCSASPGLYADIVGLDDWCKLNCPLGNCPPSHCICFDDSTSSSSTPSPNPIPTSAPTSAPTAGPASTAPTSAPSTIVPILEP